MSLARTLRLPGRLKDQHAVLVEKLTAAADQAGRYLFATIDLAAVDDSVAWLNAIKLRGNARNLFVSQPEASAESLAAWLVSLGESHALDIDLLKHSVAQAMLADSVTWIVSDVPLDALTARLSPRLTAKLPEGEALFRYYDPRLLPVIHEAWAGPIGDAFFALGAEWYFLGPGLDLRRLPLSSAKQADNFVPPVPVTLPQQEQMQAVSELHQLIRFLGLRRPDDFLAFAPVQRLAFVEAQLKRAAAFGLVRFADRLRYCELAIDHGEDFSDHPRWQSIWETVRTGDISLSKAISDTETGVEA